MKGTLLTAQAQLLAMTLQDLTFDPDKEMSHGRALELWRASLKRKGLTDEQVDQVIDLDTKAFSAEILKKNFSSHVARINEMLVRWGELEEDDIVMSMYARNQGSKPKIPATKTPAPPILGEIAADSTSLAVGTKITIKGASWAGYIAEILGDEGGYYRVTTTYPSGRVWEGRIRKASVESVIEES